MYKMLITKFEAAWTWHYCMKTRAEMSFEPVNLYLDINIASFNII